MKMNIWYSWFGRDIIKNMILLIQYNIGYYQFYHECSIPIFLVSVHPKIHQTCQPMYSTVCEHYNIAL